MHLVIVSGRSGSGKSIALKILEDLGFYCVDNLPISLLPHLIEELNKTYKKLAVGIDARNLPKDISQFKIILNKATKHLEQLETIYIDAHEKVLLKRFSETRRKHPLSNAEHSLLEAIKKEHLLLAPIANLADLTIDTSNLNSHELGHLLRERFGKGHQTSGLSILVQSFGFKYGLPADVDFIFDCRFLPNPYWVPHLRDFTGRDQPIIEFLKSQSMVQKYLGDILKFLKTWIPFFEAENRSYLTIACGCTGGIHRSVYLVNQLEENLKESFNNVQVRHRELLKKYPHGLHQPNALQHP
ncbi:MAG: RNase adapter RapZ [Gammaproteobacteria bacterium]